MSDTKGASSRECGTSTVCFCKRSCINVGCPRLLLCAINCYEDFMPSVPSAGFYLDGQSLTEFGLGMQLLK